MDALTWRLVGSVAQLQAELWSAALDIRQPAAGLSQWVLAGQPLVANLAAVELPDVVARPELLAEGFVRGGDLIAVYEPSTTRSVRVEVYWRVRAKCAAVEWPLIETIVSVQTDLLDSQPAVVVTSRLPVDHWESVDCGDGARALASRTSEARNLRHDPAPRAFLAREVVPGWGYAEVVRPDVQCHSNWTRIGGQGSRLEHRLFADPLEKGVILRAQVLGLFAPTPRLADAAGAVFREFAGSSPPLTA